RYAVDYVANSCITAFSDLERRSVQDRSTFFSFNHPSPTEIYTLSLHDALPISTKTIPYLVESAKAYSFTVAWGEERDTDDKEGKDRKSTRLNSSHLGISYAVFCLKKKIEVAR